LAVVCSGNSGKMSCSVQSVICSNKGGARPQTAVRMHDTQHDARPVAVQGESSTCKRDPGWRYEVSKAREGLDQRCLVTVVVTLAKRLVGARMQGRTSCSGPRYAWSGTEYAVIKTRRPLHGSGVILKPYRQGSELVRSSTRCEEIRKKRFETKCWSM
jgi:hypothetical protein